MQYTVFILHSFCVAFNYYNNNDYIDKDDEYICQKQFNYNRRE